MNKQDKTKVPQDPRKGCGTKGVVEMDTKEAARQLRAEYKTCGWNARAISVRVDQFSLGSDLRVTIKDVRVPWWKAKEMAEAHERVDRCKITGEILRGGNRYVTVKQESGRAEILARRHLQAVEDALSHLPETDTHTLEQVTPHTRVGRDDAKNFTLWHRGQPGCRYYDGEHGRKAAALRVALYDVDQLAGSCESKEAAVA